MANYLKQQIDRHLMKLFVPTEEELTKYPPDQAPDRLYFALGLVYAFLYFIVIPVVLFLLISLIPDTTEDFALTIVQLLTGVVYVALILVTTPWTKWFPSWMNSRFNWQKVVAYWVVIYLLNIVLSMIYMALGIEGVSGNQDTINEMVLSYPVLMGIAIVIIAPIVEELMFRFFIFGFLKKFNIWLAYAVSSLLFGLIHVIQDFAANWMFIFIYAAMGWVMAISYHHHKRIIYPILVHALNNFVGFALMLLLILIESIGII